MSESLEQSVEIGILETFNSRCEDVIDYILHDNGATIADPILADKEKKNAVRLELNKKFHEQKKRVVHAVITALEQAVYARAQHDQDAVPLLDHWASYETENLYAEVLQYINTDAEILNLQDLVGSFPETPLTYQDARALTVPLVTDLSALKQHMIPYIFRAYVVAFSVAVKECAQTQDIESVIQRTREMVRKGLRA